jgi:hypothetical protein
MEISSPTHARLRRVIVAPVMLAATAFSFTGTAVAQDDDDDGGRESNSYIRLTEPAGRPGTVTTAWGCGFAPDEPIQMSTSGQAGLREVRRLRSDARGCVAMTFSVPENARPGTMRITLDQGGRTASTNFRVEESSGRTSERGGMPERGRITEQGGMPEQGGVSERTGVSEESEASEESALPERISGIR